MTLKHYQGELALHNGKTDDLGGSTLAYAYAVSPHIVMECAVQLAGSLTPPLMCCVSGTQRRRTRTKPRNLVATGTDILIPHDTPPHSDKAL